MENRDINMLMKELEASKMIHEQIAVLSSEKDLKKAMNSVLENIGRYMGADRAYIFEKRKDFYSNTFEWCAEGVQAEIDTLQELSEDDLSHWLKLLSAGDCVVISDIEEIRESDPLTYETLKRQDISSVVEAPITMGGGLAGFIGVDNAGCDMVGIISDSLTVLGAFIGTVMQNKLEHDALAQERKSYRDALANGSEFTFLFDVTEGMIYNEFTTAHNVNIIKELGFSLPVSFDDLLQVYALRADIQFLQEGMENHFVSKNLLKHFENGTTNVVTEFYTPDTGIFIRTNCLMSLDDATGHVMGAVVAEDITELRMAEAAQKEALEKANRILSEANSETNVRLDTILNGIAGGLKIVDYDTELIVFLSDGAAMLQGYTSQEFMDKFNGDILSNIYSEDRERVDMNVKKQLENSHAYSAKYRIIHKDGSIKWVVDHGKLVEDPATGKSFYYILIQDITELEDRTQKLSNALTMQREMSDSLGSGILAYSIPQHKVLMMNEEAQKMLSFNNISFGDELPGLTERVLPEDLPVMREAVKKLVNVGDRVTYVLHVARDKDMLSAYKMTTKLLSFDNGQRYILSSISDITEQENMKKRIDEERRKYRDALVYGSEAFFSIDLPDGKITEGSLSHTGQEVIRSLGIEFPATYDDFIAVLFAEENSLMTGRDLRAALDKSGMMNACINGDEIIDFEYFIPANKKFYHIMALPDNIGGVCRVTFIIYDISSDRLEDQQRRTVIGTLGKIYSDLYHISFRDNSYTAYKRSKNVALPPEDGLDNFIKVYGRDLVQPEFQEMITEFLNPENIKKKLSSADYTTVEYRRKDLGWCRITLAAADRDSNGTVNSVVFAENVIEAQKQAELSQQEALKVACEAANIANAAKTDFLANMSHDIRTPMNAIIGMTAIAGTHLDDKERVADCLSKITVSSKHLLGIINEVLDMSKIESGKLELQEEEFNLSELIDNLLTMSKPAITAKNHTLTVTLSKINHEEVIGDSQHIQQVFMNIMSNAIKYTPEGGKIKLTISEKDTKKSRTGCYEFVVEDNGIGMDEEFLEHIFEPFARARNDRRIEKIQGTGLGMPITRNIVQMMNGDIKVESKLNEGTRITVTIILKLKNEEDKALTEQFADLPVLIADDDRISCEYTCNLLEELGMKGEWVLSGQEAVNKTVVAHENDNDFFAVILDWKMPNMDGLEAARQIRSRVGEDVPIIIISAYDWSDIELEARSAGVNAFISKPLFKSRMIHLFNELIGGKTEKESAVDAISQADFSGKRVLLVEDNELNAEIAGEILSMAGITVEFAVNGKEAVDIMTDIGENYFDVIFMDIQMPIMNGYEATRAIRALPGSYPKSVPIIAMTANAFSDDIVAAKNAGMNEHIAKPLDFDQLLRVLKKWL